MKKTAIILCMLLVFSSFNTYAYNISDSLYYASLNYDSGEGLCAEFVSMCLKAGGVNIFEPMASNLYKELTKSGTANVLKIEDDLRVKKSKNEDILREGDVVIQHCIDCDDYFHAVLCGGFYDGYMTYYAHNYAHGNTKDDMFYNVPSQSHKGHIIESVSLRIDGGFFGDVTYKAPPKAEYDKYAHIEYSLYKVSAETGLNLRKTSAPDSDILLTMPSDSIVKVYPLLSEGDRLFCIYNSTEGFASSDYLKPVNIVKAFDMSVIINGADIEDKPYVVESSAYLPVRVVFESLGGEVNWNGETKSADINLNHNKISVSTGADSFKINNENKEMIMPTVIINNKLYISARSVFEALGKEVLWKNGKIYINS